MWPMCDVAPWLLDLFEEFPTMVTFWYCRFGTPRVFQDTPHIANLTRALPFAGLTHACGSRLSSIPTSLQGLITALTCRDLGSFSEAVHGRSEEGYDDRTHDLC